LLGVVSKHSADKPNHGLRWTIRELKISGELRRCLV
jgi:hypothetical protein